MTINRRAFLTGSAAALAMPGLVSAQEAPGVTANEIRIGSTNALSGPASSYSVISRCLSAMFKRLNDEGGVNGRKVNFIVYDDGYAPPKTLEQTRRLVEQDRVAFLFNQLGTPTNSACPPDSKVTSTCSTTSSCPKMTRAISARASAARAPKASASATNPSACIGIEPLQRGRPQGCRARQGGQQGR